VNIRLGFRTTSHYRSIIVFELERTRRRLPWDRMCKNVIFDRPKFGPGSGDLTYMKVGRDEDDDGSPDITLLPSLPKPYCSRNKPK
jgi:hypothetical protein